MKAFEENFREYLDFICTLQKSAPNINRVFSLVKSWVDVVIDYIIEVEKI